ncbi:MAG: exo-alpha-sialidase [Lentisphaerae bacterium]|nr:exo-alpha-sialidase [Lentisphaerota bacterium]
MRLIADEKIFYRSPDPENLYCYTPWLDYGFDKRLIASFDIAGSGLKNELGPKSEKGDYGGNQMRIFVSDDSGATWRETGRLPMLHARVFAAGKCLYALGHGGKLLISKSSDNGETWSEPAVLDSEMVWHQSACGYEKIAGKIWITMEKVPYQDHWQGGDPVLMCADENSDLTKLESWKFSNLLKFEDIAPAYEAMAPAGELGYAYLESNVVFERDVTSEFYGKFLIFLRSNRCRFPDTAHVITGGEDTDGSLYLKPVSDKLFYVPFPGGGMKFQTIYDEKSKLYWLIASHSTYTTFTRADALNAEVRRFSERNRLELFYSQNCFDWSSAGVVACGESYLESRHYASLLPDGDDLLVLSRSGDKEAKNCHDTNLITLHRVRDFRSLA